MKLLTICPSRNRPDKLARMIESFYATKTGDTEIVVYISDDDPQLERNKEVLKDTPYILGPRRTLVKALNYVSTGLYPAEYYQEVNDDHIYRTKGWDEGLIGEIENGGGWGIATANDLMTNEPWEVARHPSAAIISGNIVRTLGCFVLPNLDHLFTDTYLRDIAEGIGHYYRRTDIIIEHCHFLSNKAKADDYSQVYYWKNYKEAHGVYFKWMKYDRANDIKKLKEAMDGGL